MLKACKYCGKIHDTHYDCGRKPERIRKRTTDRKSTCFRRSEAWTKKSREIRERDGYLCQICVRKLHGTIRQFNYDALSVHHIMPVNEDYEKRLDDDNLLTVCRMHHEMCESGVISRDEQEKIALEQGTPPGGGGARRARDARPHTAQKRKKYSSINFYTRIGDETMPTPKKAASVLESERTAHKTKREIAQRKQAEQAALTGNTLKETDQTKGNELAHREFRRMSALLKKIEKNDDIYRNVVNRYCMLQAECTEFVEKRELVYNQLIEFEKKKDELAEDGEITWREAYRIMSEMQSNVITFDKQIQTKRKMMLDIEKENGWTVKASIQTIPPKRENKISPLKEALLNG